MPNLVGIIHPYAFQPSSVMGKITKTYESVPNSIPFRFFRSKNLEVGTWNLTVGCHNQKSIWTFFSGFLYNKPALITQLKVEGYKIKDENDLLAYAYDAWGESCIEKLDGPFFIVIYDEKKERLLLSLDRMGQKSLYWVDQGNYFLFGSDIKGILATGLVSQNPSPSSLSSYLYFGYIPQDYSAIQSINKLLPGNTLTISLKRQYQLKNYWSLSQAFMQNKGDSFEGAMDRFGALLKDKVSLFPDSKQPLSIEWNTQVGAGLLNYETFHCRSRELLTTIAESKKQEQLANPFQWNLTPYALSIESVLDDLPQLVWMLDEPIADLKAISRWYLAKTSGPHLFSSMGFEELFALHERYHIRWVDSSSFTTSIVQDLAHTPPWLRDRWIRPFLQAIHPPSAFRMLRNIDIDSRQVRYLNYIALFKGPSRKFVSHRLYPFFDPEVFAQRFHRLSTLSHSINPALYFDLKTSLPDLTLFQYERLFPPNGVQVHQPFLTNDFLDFASSLPGIYSQSKQTQEESFIDHYLKQHNIELPMLKAHRVEAEWSQSSRLRKIFKSLQHGRLVEDEWIDPLWIERQLKPRVMTPLAFQQMWSLLMLELWIRLFIVRPVDTIDPKLKTEQIMDI
jgi:asparagine synthase (glutamine-hydrolysing)